MEPLSRVTRPTLDVLGVLLARREPTWGLLVIKESGRAAGTVYPILERLEQRGWISSAWEADESRPGPRRRLYTLTSDGAAAARELVAQPDSRTQPRPASHPARPRPAGLAATAGSIAWSAR